MRTVELRMPLPTVFIELLLGLLMVSNGSAQEAVRIWNRRCTSPRVPRMDELFGRN